MTIVDPTPIERPEDDPNVLSIEYLVRAIRRIEARHDTVAVDLQEIVRSMGDLPQAIIDRFPTAFDVTTVTPPEPEDYLYTFTVNQRSQIEIANNIGDAPFMFEVYPPNQHNLSFACLLAADLIRTMNGCSEKERIPVTRPKHVIPLPEIIRHTDDLCFLTESRDIGIRVLPKTNLLVMCYIADWYAAFTGVRPDYPGRYIA